MAPHPPSKALSGSPALARETSQTPGRDTVQPQPIESAPNGVHVNGIHVENEVETSSPTTTPVPQSVQPPSQSSAQPSPLSTQPPSVLTHVYRVQNQAIPAPLVPHGQPASSSTPQPYQQYQGPHSSSAPPPSIPSPSPFGHFHREPRDMNKSKSPRRFASPHFDHDAQIPRFNRDVSLVADVVQQACPEAVRRVIRDKWEKCVMGSEFHHAFLMNATMHHASGDIMRRAIRDFGRNMVVGAKAEIASHLGPEDLDDIAPVILEKCSDKFLDKALEQRLKTIDARSLINALARAERLGYENSDILEDQPERVVPAARQPQFPQTGPGGTAITYPAQPVSQPVPPSSDLKCRMCWRQFNLTRTYEYHVQKQLCVKARQEQYSFWCDTCGAGFTTKNGKQYHDEKGVCGSHDTAPATPRTLVPTPINYPNHIVPPSSHPYPMPSQPTSSPVGNPSPLSDDPYGHLTQERRAQLEEELRQAEISYIPRFAEAEAITDTEAKKAKLESLHNTFSTKQSMIRKKYGVRLRVRRTRQEIEAERLRRLGVKHGPSSPGSGAGTPSAKRQRSDNGPNGSGTPSHISRGPPAPAPNPQPINHLSISQMNNSGLGGSTATAATTDPTASIAPSQLPLPPAPAKEASPETSLSSLQRKGYRVSSHIRQSTQPASPSLAERKGSASIPVVVDVSSDSDTDTDMDEIPATIPPKKSS
ncbi:hypothetical protein F5B22DRAFT_647295 [Xylaria bambusicola]|uniref:uncharacterized protein n=1 Tax=Xylaria bambusicola TaxID=326684 RepID=UPI0020080372|nr:uncharacterized protein F5B22DRAFT_647295 [Xylaria bambusicola]KAI0514814.1 hypothetical protein F5B22DRAFT_647295 [Xylaria bambusicola]